MRPGSRLKHLIYRVLYFFSIPEEIVTKYASFSEYLCQFEEEMVIIKTSKHRQFEERWGAQMDGGCLLFILVEGFASAQAKLCFCEYNSSIIDEVVVWVAFLSHDT